MRYVDRWFHAHTIKQAIDSLLTQVAAIQRDLEDFDQPVQRPNDTSKIVWLVVGGLGLSMVLLVGGLLASGKRNQNPNPRGMVMTISMLGLFIGGAGWMTYVFCRGSAQQRQKRENAIFELTRRNESLRPGHYGQLPDNIGTFPWLATEHDLLAHCNYFGNHKGFPFVALEYSYLVDTLLSRLDSSLGKLAATVMSHVEHQKILRMQAEVIIFLEPVDQLPDVFFSAKKEPQRWYFQEMLARSGVEPDGVASKDRWLACSEADRSKEIYHCLDPLTKSHPTAFVEILGGYCAVVTKTWIWNRPADAPHKVEELEQNLEMATSVYSALQGLHSEKSQQRANNPAEQRPSKQGDAVGSPSDFSVAE